MSITAMKQALEALEYLQGIVDTERGPKAAESLRQAIAEAEKQEPDVIMHPHDGTWDIINSPPTGVDDVALYYTHPQPKREPLTDEQVEKIIKANMSLQMNLAGIRQDFEAAHGIKGEA